MKTILVPTDFSAAADNAARYALQVAQFIKADVRLCNAIKVPAASVFADAVVWPLHDYDSLRQSVDKELKDACDKLADEIGVRAFPRIDFVSRQGEVADVVSDIVKTGNIPLVVMGLSGAGAVSKFFLGSNSEEVMEQANFPLLLIPEGVPFKSIKKIAFSTDFNKRDLEAMYSLVNFARHLDAEIMIAHITGEDHNAVGHKNAVEGFLSEISCKANYDKIYYRHVKSEDVNEGLEWICQQSHSDMIVMSHGKAGFIESFFDRSHTKKLARHVNIPLMIYPKHSKSTSLFVF